MYYFSVFQIGSFEKTIEKVSLILMEEGFGIVTEIDVKDIMKKKLDIDFRNYKILGACNPSFAFKALQREDKIGTMLPCNIVVQEIEEGKIEVSAINPMESMMAIDNNELKEIAKEITNRLKMVIKKLDAI